MLQTTHFTDGETEAKAVKLLAQDHATRTWYSYSLNSGHLAESPHSSSICPVITTQSTEHSRSPWHRQIIIWDRMWSWVSREILSYKKKNVIFITVKEIYTFKNDFQLDWNQKNFQEYSKKKFFCKNTHA